MIFWDTLKRLFLLNPFPTPFKGVQPFLAQTQFLRVVAPDTSFYFPINFSAIEQAYAAKNCLWTSFLALNKMVKIFLKNSKIFNNLGKKSESNQF